MSEHADRILAAIEADDDTSALVASWRRCRTLYDLHPDRVEAPDRDLIGWREACDRDAQLIQIAEPYLDELFRLLKDVDCAVFLVERHGMVVAMRSSRARDSFGRSPDHCIGTTFSERLLGTNSMGTGVIEKRSLVLRGSSHFLTHYTNFVCLSAPLFGPNAEYVGCLAINQNAAAHDARLDPFFSISVAAFAQRIESELFARAFPRARLMLAAPLGRRPDALLAIDPDDCVLGATHAARRVLGLSAQSMDRPVDIAHLLEQQLPAQLADAERRMIERTLTRCGGNISAAAKAMGVSRSTLYRKIARYAIQADRAPLNVR